MSMSLPTGQTAAPTASTSRAATVPALLRGGVLLYLLSAALLLAGTNQLLRPLYEGQPHPRWLAALGVLNLYELALLGVTLLIVVVRKVLDDAVALVCLIAAFLIASTAALDTIGPPFPRVAAAAAAAGLLLYVGKVWALQRLVFHRRFELLALVGMSLLMAWNCVMPVVLSAALWAGQERTTMQQWWLLGAGVQVVLALPVVVSVLRLRVGALDRDAEQPWLRSALMPWVVVGVFVAGSLTHQCALGWAFHLSLSEREFLLALTLAAVLLIEAGRVTRKLAGVGEMLLACGVGVPIALAVQGWRSDPQPLSWAWVNRPAVAALAMLAYCLWRAWGAWRERVACTTTALEAALDPDGKVTSPDQPRAEWGWLVLALGFAGLTLIDLRWHESVGGLFRAVLAAVSWPWVFGILGGICGLATFFMPRLTGALWTAAGTWVCLTLMLIADTPANVLEQFLGDYFGSSAAWLSLSLFMLVALALHRREANWVMALVVWGVLALSAWRASQPWLTPLLVDGALVVVGVLTAWHWRRYWFLWIGLAPGATDLTLHLQEHPGWVMVTGAFLLLALGGAVSWRKGQRFEPGPTLPRSES